jgi:hypothetical protein
LDDAGGRKLTYVAADAAGAAITLGGNDVPHAVLARPRGYGATRGKRIQ